MLKPAKIFFLSIVMAALGSYASAADSPAAEYGQRSGSNDAPAADLIHFYSDPLPFVAPPAPSSDYDPAFADFELSRLLPPIDAPAGLYGFAFKGTGIEITASHTYTQTTIQAGQVVAFNMLVTNNSGVAGIFTERMAAPEGIRAVHEIAPFAIEAGQTLSRRISLRLDKTLAAGQQRISYAITTSPASKVEATLEFKFAVQPRPRLQFVIASMPILIENKSFKVTGKLINIGNTDLNVHLQLQGPAGLTMAPNHVSLPSGGYTTITINGTAPKRNHPLDDIFQLQLSATTDQKSGSEQLLDEPIKLRIGN